MNNFITILTEFVSNFLSFDKEAKMSKPILYPDVYIIEDMNETKLDDKFRLSKNFTASEFKCSHCGKIKVSLKLITGLQKLRNNTRHRIIISSGYRCKDHYIEKAKSTPGQHTIGCAADIIIVNMNALKALDYILMIEEFKNGGIGLYPDSSSLFFHVDTRASGIARWSYIKGIQRSYADGLLLLKRVSK